MLIMIMIPTRLQQWFMLLTKAPTDVQNSNGHPQRNGGEDGRSNGCYDADVRLWVIQRQQEQYDGNASVLNSCLDGHRQDVLARQTANEGNQPTEHKAQVWQQSCCEEYLQHSCRVTASVYL